MNRLLVLLSFFVSVSAWSQTRNDTAYESGKIAGYFIGGGIILFFIIRMIVRNNRKYMKAVLFLTALLLSLGANAQKKPTKFIEPVAVDESDDEGYVILPSPSSHGTFTVTGKEAGKTTKQQVNYLCYGNDTTWMSVCDEANFVFRSAKPVALTVKVEKYDHPEVVYDIPVTVNGNHYHLDLTPLSEIDPWGQTSYTFAIYDDKKNLVHEINWNLYCVQGDHE